MSQNLKLWNDVVHTDPNYTKQFSRGGGFKGTAINFVYLARKATEQFGPVGIGWGANMLDEKYERGAKMDNGDHEVVHVVRIRFWYKLDDKRGEIESFGQTTFVGQNKNGPFTDEEAPKKSMTDAMSKAMSWLGFGADVHLGLFDDNKYVNEARKEHGKGKRAEGGEPAAQEALPSEEPQADASPAAISKRQIIDFELMINGASSIDDLRFVKETIFSACQAAASAGGADAWRQLKQIIAQRKVTIEEGGE